MKNEADILGADGPFHGRKWVRIMCDFCAEGVWNIEGESICANDLPIEDDLLARILRWQFNYDVKADDSEGSFDFKLHDAEGLAVAYAVKLQLPEWTVIFFEEAKARLPPTTRAKFEYEVVI